MLTFVALAIPAGFILLRWSQFSRIRREQAAPTQIDEAFLQQLNGGERHE